MNKQEITLIICAVTLIVTTIYLWDNFYGWTRFAWALWGLAIWIGTTISTQEINKKKNRK